MVVMVDEEHMHAPSKTWKECGERERKKNATKNKKNEKNVYREPIQQLHHLSLNRLTHVLIGSTSFRI